MNQRPDIIPPSYRLLRPCREPSSSPLSAVGRKRFRQRYLSKGWIVSSVGQHYRRRRGIKPPNAADWETSADCSECHKARCMAV